MAAPTYLTPNPSGPGNQVVSGGKPGALAALDAGGYVPLSALRVRRAQFLNALEVQAAGNGQALLNAVPANPGDPLNLAYWDSVVEPGGTLATKVQSLFGFTAAQMTALFASAATQGN